VGVSFSVDVVVGFPLGEVSRECETVSEETRYDEKTGKPYQKKTTVKDGRQVGTRKVGQAEWDNIRWGLDKGRVEVFDPSPEEDGSGAVLGVLFRAARNVGRLDCEPILLDDDALASCREKAAGLFRERFGIEERPRVYVVALVS
jgi:hypothetical protein